MAKSFFTRLGWVRESVTDGPRTPLTTRTTYERSRVPCAYSSPGTCSCAGRMASSLPMSTRTFFGSRPCWTTPITTSPSRPAYSPKVISSSASRSRWRMTCLAVVAAIRPKPDGVSSNSRGSAPSSRSAGSSLAHTVTCPVLRSSSTRAWRRLPSVRWYAMRRADSMAATSRSNEISFSRTKPRRALMSMSTATPPPGSRRSARRGRRAPGPACG